jgi:hypothetical protein
MIVAFVGFSRILLPGILIFKGLTTRRLYKSFDVNHPIMASQCTLVNAFKGTIY